MNWKTEYSFVASTWSCLLASVGLLLTADVARADQTIADNLIIQGFLDVAGPVTITTTLSPSINFNQVGDITHAAQKWQVFANEAEFSLSNLTDPQNLRFPFSLRASAPDDSFVIGDLGFVGINIPFPTNPQAPLHVNAKAGTTTAESIAMFTVADDTVGRLVINNNSSTNGIFHPRIQGLAKSQATPLNMEGLIGSDVGGNPCVSFNAAKSIGGAIVNRPLVAFRNNITIKAFIAANGDMTATSFNPSSSRKIKEHIRDLDSHAAAAALRQLTPVEFVYKDDHSREQRVGFIAEDVPEIVANADRKSVPIMDVVALVTRVVKDQQQTIERQAKTIDELNGRLKESSEAQQSAMDSQRQSAELQAKAIKELTDRLTALEARKREEK